MKATKQLDFLASWITEETWLEKYDIIRQPEKIDYNILEFAYRLDKPWTMALKGKKVLVVSPFADDIKAQYQSEKRHKLFANKNFLKDFDLETVTSVNSAGEGNTTSFRDWFQALESMKSQIGQIDFDIALLGCGAYVNISAQMYTS